MILATGGTSKSTIYDTLDTVNTASIMAMQPDRSRKGGTTGNSSLDFATVASSVDDVDNFGLCLLRSHCAPICILLNEAKKKLITNDRHVNLGALQPRTSFCQGSRSPRRRGGTTPNSFRLGKCSSRRSGGPTKSSFRPGNCSPWGSGGATPSARASVTVARVAALLAELVSIQKNTTCEGQTDGNLTPSDRLPEEGAQYNCIPRFDQPPVTNRKLASSRLFPLLATGHA